MGVALTGFSKNTTVLIDALIDSKPVGNLLQKVEHGLKDFGGYLHSPGFKHDAKRFLEGWDRLGGWPLCWSAIQIEGALARWVSAANPGL